ncbi:MAG: 50S ribosomal protein L25 [Candidatus Levybacteria bacterium]|nr:50S ribosomal protein L25 [Candidatus Levybacteria bacterium]
MANQRPLLQAQKREIVGKKVRKLRREGFIPANIYGKSVISTSIQIKEEDFNPLFKEVGQTGLIDIEINGEKKPVLVQNYHKEPLSRKVLHVNFYQVNLKEKIKSMIPVIMVGIPIAVSEKIGLLLQPISEVEVEALPAELPEKFEINVEHLSEIDDQVTVEDIKAPEGVTIISELSQIVAKIDDLISDETKELIAEEAAAAETATEEENTSGEEEALKTEEVTEEDKKE